MKHSTESIERREWSAEVIACLRRRRRLLSASLSETAATCEVNIEETERTLKAWATPPALDWAGAACMPLGVKDVIDVAGLPTRAGSRSRATSAPARLDAEVIIRLRQAGYTPVGKTETTEFAYIDPAPTTNPFEVCRTPGGSSSGSAAAVGAGQIPVAIGTQTSGSMCRPAAFCGAYAFKPSTGRTSTMGVTAFARSFDTVGAYGLRLQWAVDVAMVMLGEPQMRCRDDGGSIALPTSRHLTIGVADDEYFLGVSEDVAKTQTMALNCLREAGHLARSVRFGCDFHGLRENHRLMMQFEAFQAHRHLLERRHELGTAWLELLEAGSRLTAREYADAGNQVARIRHEMSLRTTEVDLMLVPPVFTTAPHGLHSTGNAGLIVPWTCAGSPLTVLPTGLDQSGAPLAIMLAGSAGDDAAHARVSLHVGKLLEEAGHTIDRDDLKL